MSIYRITFGRNTGVLVKERNLCDAQAVATQIAREDFKRGVRRLREETRVVSVTRYRVSKARNG